MQLWECRNGTGCGGRYWTPRYVLFYNPLRDVTDVFLLKLHIKDLEARMYQEGHTAHIFWDRTHVKMHHLEAGQEGTILEGYQGSAASCFAFGRKGQIILFHAWCLSRPKLCLPPRTPGIRCIGWLVGFILLTSSFRHIEIRLTRMIACPRLYAAPSSYASFRAVASAWHFCRTCVRSGWQLGAKTAKIRWPYLGSEPPA